MSVICWNTLRLLVMLLSSALPLIGRQYESYCRRFDMLLNSLAEALPTVFASDEVCFVVETDMISGDIRARSRIWRCSSDRLGFFCFFVIG